MFPSPTSSRLEYEDVTADFVYIHLHGAVTLYQSRYSDAELDRFAVRSRAWASGREPDDARFISMQGPARRSTRDVFCYFDNTDKMEAPGNAMQLAAKLASGPA